MILIDGVYIHSFGGKFVLELILEKLILKEIGTYYFLLDKRLKSKLLNKIPKKNIKLINSVHSQRCSFYKINIKRFESVICLSNVPPPILTEVKTVILFHNVLLLNPLSHEITFKSRINNFLKINYINYFNHKKYNWVVQSLLVKEDLQDYLNINSGSVFILPIFKEKYRSPYQRKSTKNFVYVSSGVPHKNHIRLISAFILVANNTKKEIKLHLTLNKKELPEKVYPSNLKIEFHGTLAEDEVNKLYGENEFAIYPSLLESFGLPLIEAANHDCKVIASDLPYVHEIIEPSLTFDPYSIESISNAILNVIDTDDLSKTKVLVENKLDNFIEFIISQDVQK